MTEGYKEGILLGNTDGSKDGDKLGDTDGLDG